MHGEDKRSKHVHNFSRET